MDLGGSHLSFCVLLHIFWGAMLQVFELLVTRLSWILAISRSRTPGEKPILMFLTFRNLVPSAPIGPHSEIDVIIFTPPGKLVSKPTSPSSHQPHWSRWSHLSRLPHLSSLSRLSHLSHRTHLSHWSHQSGLSHLSHLCGSPSRGRPSLQASTHRLRLAPPCPCPRWGKELPAGRTPGWSPSRWVGHGPAGASAGVDAAVAGNPDEHFFHVFFIKGAICPICPFSDSDVFVSFMCLYICLQFSAEGVYCLACRR